MRIHLRPFLDPPCAFLAAGLGLALLGLAAGLACGGGGGGGSVAAPLAGTAPVIASDPASVALDLGQAATFTVAALGSPAPAFQWQRSDDGGGTWAAVSAGTGGGSAVYTTAATALGDSGAQFRAVASNSAGSRASGAATLTVNPALAIATPPASASVAIGEAASLAVTATGGTAPLSYQWRLAGAAVGGDSATLALGAVTPASAGSYTVTVTDSAPTPESATSAAAILTVTGTRPLAAVLPRQMVPQVTTQAVLSPTVAGGLPPYSYAWSFAGKPLAGATGSSYAIPSLRLADEGTYAVKVTDAAGTTSTASTNLFVATSADLPAGLNPVGVAATANIVYFTSPEQNRVLKLNRADPKPLMIPVAGGPTGVALDADGNLWLALNTVGQVAMVSAETGNLAGSYAVGGNPYGIAKDSSNQIWFTLQGTDQIGRLPAGGGTPTLFSLSTGASPGGLCSDPDGTVWFTEPGLGRVGRIRRGASQAEEYACPNQYSRPQQILATSGGQVFYTDQNAASVVQFPVDAQASASAAQAGAQAALVVQGALLQAQAYDLEPQGGPAGIALDASGNVWLTQKGNGKVTQVNPATQGTYVYALPSSQSQPAGVTVASDGAVWVTMPGTNQIAQIPPARTPITVTVAGVEPRRELEGGKDHFGVTVTGATTDASVTWSLLEGAAAGTIDQTGAYTATTTPGIYHVLATSNEDPAVYGRLELLVCPWTSWPKGTMTVLAGDVAGLGNLDGTGAAARFDFPRGLAADAAGSLYVGDWNNQIIRKVSPAGVVTTVAGRATEAGSVDGPAASARFFGPAGVALDAAGTLYIADSYNNTIRKLSPAGIVTTLAGAPGTAGATDGPGGGARFNSPMGLTVDAAGNVYVADMGNDTIRMITPAGSVSTLAGTPGVPWSSSHPGMAYFSTPTGVCLGPGGTLYVADPGSATIRVIDPATRTVRLFAGTPGSSGSTNSTLLGSTFNWPSGVATDAAGNVYVTDTTGVRKLVPGNPGSVSLWAGSPTGERGATDGTGTGARFRSPYCIATDSSGNVYVGENENFTIRKLTNTTPPAVTTLAGKAAVIGTQDNPVGTLAEFGFPSGITINASGTAYVIDSLYVSAAIRQITAGGAVTTYVSSGLASPWDLVCSPQGNLYLVGDNAVFEIPESNPTVNLLAGAPGKPGFAGGSYANARFYSPAGVTLDAAGNLYVVDPGQGAIQEVLTGQTQQVVIFARGLGYPLGITCSHGDIYVAECYRCDILKISPTGQVSVFAGQPNHRGFRDGPAGQALFNLPNSLASDQAGNLYVADTDNNAIRLITPAGFVYTLVGDPASGINRAGPIRDGVDLPLPANYGAVACPLRITCGPDGSVYLTANSGILKVAFTSPP